MTTAEALLRSVLCVPDCDTRRLAFADHLDETAVEVECRCQGDPKRNLRFDRKKERWVHGCDWCSGSGRVSDGKAERAEFVRIQVELPRLRTTHYHYWGRGNCDGCKGDRLRRRESELLPLCPHWFEVGADKTEWERGFVSGITWNTEQFMRHAAAIFAAMPVTEVRLTDREPHRDNGLFGWFSPIHEADGCPTPSAHVPIKLIAIMQKMKEAKKGQAYECDGWWKRWADFSSADLAHAALSRACVAFGRKDAHLPPLVTPGARPARVG